MKKTLKGKLVSSAEGVVALAQHARPCSDCPFRRDSLKGWLGGSTPEQYVRLAHSDERIDCHVLLGAQCAGGAIYRRHVCKVVRDPGVLTLGPDHRLVFDSPA